MNPPQYLFFRTENQNFAAPFNGCRFPANDAVVNWSPTATGGRIEVTAEQTLVCYLGLRWDEKTPVGGLFLCDAWERTYGDSEWRASDPSRIMPWYFFLREKESFLGFGVKVQGGAFAFWQADPEGVTLWLDLRNGASGVRLNGRTLSAAEVVRQRFSGCGFPEASRRFCRMLCNRPLLPEQPVYGGNNWYYAYGDSSREQILDDCRRIADLSAGCTNRPFMVIDDGWQTGERTWTYNGGPWEAGNARFPHMETLPDAMRGCGVRPGIWFRPLQNRAAPETWKLVRKGAVEVLDPTIPEAAAQIQRDVRRLHNWGFELLKHDFSTFDLFGCWGFEARPWLATGDWHFHDRSLTSAEVVRQLYATILNAADRSLILGCNIIGHLGAGLTHIVRTGDDTSGKSWERTRKMGINTLAFRLGQHGTFFELDADCVGVTKDIPWILNREWAELLARSGTAFFASIKPGVLTEAETREMAAFFRIAAERDSPLEPMDELTTTVPACWRDGQGKIYHFNWYSGNGVSPDFLSY